MVGTIRFPHLGITLPHVIKSVHVFGVEIACYGMVLAAAMVTGILLMMKLAGRTGQNQDDYFDFGMIAILTAVVCARIYYVVFSWDYYSAHPGEIFNLRGGGLAIYGGIAGGAAAAAVFCKVRRMNFLRAADTAVPALAWGQMIGRWGNFFNREAFGTYTDNLFAMQIPAADVRASEITQEMEEHILEIEGIRYVQVHPTFLYESLWNLGVFLVLLILTFRKKPVSRGTVTLSYLLLYGTGRFWIEGLRTDQLLLTGTAVPVSQLLSAVLVLAAAVCLGIKSSGILKRRTRPAVPQAYDGPLSAETEISGNTAAMKGTKDYENERDTDGEDRGGTQKTGRGS